MKNFIWYILFMAEHYRVILMKDTKRFYTVVGIILLAITVVILYNYLEQVECILNYRPDNNFIH